MKKIFILMAGALLLASCAKEAGPSAGFLCVAVLSKGSAAASPAPFGRSANVILRSPGPCHSEEPKATKNLDLCWSRARSFASLRMT